MLEGDGIVGLLLLGLWVFAIFDVIMTDDLLVRNLPKMVWLFLVIVLPDVGAIAWLALGRPINAGWRPGDTTVRAPRRRPIGLEDRADWRPATPSRPAPRPAAIEPPPIDTTAKPPGDGPDPAESLAVRERRLMEWEAELKRREASLDEDGGGPSPT